MPLPLTDFTLKRFRGIQDSELKQLGRVNLLVGENNSGKTSVLEALLLYGRPFDPLAWQRTAALREGLVLQERVPELLRWLFPGDQSAEMPLGLGQGTCTLQGTGAFPVRKLQASYVLVERVRAPAPSGVTGRGQRIIPVSPGSEAFETTDWGIQLKVEVVYEKLSVRRRKRLKKPYTFWPDEAYIRTKRVSEPRLKVEFVSPYGHRSEQTLSRKVKKATLQEYKQEVLHLVQRLDETIEDIVSLPGFGQDASLYFKVKGRGHIPVNSVGDGVRRALNLALSLLDARGSILLVDELESAFHFSALERVFSWLVSACHQYDVQLFATTHSIEAVDAILAVDTTPEEDIVAYRLELQGERHEVVRLGEGDLRLLRYRLGQEVR
jgi:hypothetical protein